jgi:hypothetical protein
MMVTMSRGYIYILVCWRDRAGQLRDNGALGREGRGEDHGYSEVPR